MFKTFKAKITRKFLEIIQKNPTANLIAEEVIQSTGFSIRKVLTQCTLEFPDKYSPDTDVLVTWLFKKKEGGQIRTYIHSEASA